MPYCNCFTRFIFKDIPFIKRKNISKFDYNIAIGRCKKLHGAVPCTDTKSIKEIDIKLLEELFINGGVSKQRVSEVIELVMQEITELRVEEFSPNRLIIIMNKALENMGYTITENYFLLHDFICSSYPRLASRDCVVIFHNEEDEGFLNNEYRFDNCVKTYDYNNVCSMILSGKCRKVVIDSVDIEGMTPDKVNMLALLSERHEVGIEVLVK